LPADADVIGQPWTLQLTDWDTPQIRKEVNATTGKTGTPRLPLPRCGATFPPYNAHCAIRRAALAVEIVMDDVIRLTDVEVHKQRIHGVAQAKKREEAKIYKESGQVVMRQERQLFAYKFYIDQEPLDVPTERLNEVRRRPCAGRCARRSGLRAAWPRSR